MKNNHNKPKGKLEVVLWELNEMHYGLERTKIKFTSIKNDRNRHFGDEFENF